MSPALLSASGFLLLGTTIFGLVEPIYALHCESYLSMGKLRAGYMLAYLSVVYSGAGFPAGAIGDKSGQYAKVYNY